MHTPAAKNMKWPSFVRHEVTCVMIILSAVLYQVLLSTLSLKQKTKLALPGEHIYFFPVLVYFAKAIANILIK